MVVGLATPTPSQSTRHGRLRRVLAISTPSSGVIPVESPEQDRVSRSFPKPAAGEVAQADGQTLNSRRVGALPILDRFLRRLGIGWCLRMANEVLRGK